MFPASIDPARLAYYEAAGWRAYYDRAWLRAFWLLVALNRKVFRMGWADALAASIDSVRASIAFAPEEDNDIPKAKRHLEKFYTRARRSLGLQADPASLAGLEIEYWTVHRQLAMQRQQNPEAGNIEPLVATLARLHAALFDATPEAMAHSAELRARAAEIVDRITGRRSKDIEADWRLVETYLMQAYSAAVAYRGPKEDHREPVGDSFPSDDSEEGYRR